VESRRSQGEPTPLYGSRTDTVLGRIPKLAWYKSAEPKEVGGFYFGINQGEHQYLLRKKFWSELTPEEQKRVETIDSLGAIATRDIFRARREAEEKQKNQQQ
jgi:hypothetical protein